MKRLQFLPLILLAACGGSGGDGSNGDAGAAPPVVIIGSGGDWLRGFVESFDTAAVAAVRKSAGFLANNVTYTMTVPGHPVYDGGARVRANAILAARVDYAHSTGLTGAGQTVAIIDDGIFAAHEQFADKSVLTYGTGVGDHGTRVASVATGKGTQGAIGVAPGADVFMAAMPFETTIDWRSVAKMVDQAAATGAISLNNSWSIGSVAESGKPSEILSGSAGQAYISALRNFAKSGVIVFSAQNDYGSESINVMAAIPMSYPDLEDSFLAVINAIPTFDEDRILSAERVSAACGEAAAWCMAADGQLITASNTGVADYALGSGASFAAPQVAGALALLAEAFPDLTPEQLRARLLATADNGFFTPTASVEFADGITHGYNAEFGHGFLDLRDALLPIGTAEVPIAASADGAGLALGTAAITGSALTGKAIAASLSDSSIVAIDALDGVFEISGDALTTNSAAISLDAWRLGSLLGADIAGERRASNAALASGIGYGARPDLFAAPGALAMAGNAVQDVPLGATSQMSLIGLDQGNTGLGLSHSFAMPGGAMSLGVQALEEDGSVMGMTTPGQGAHGQALAFDLGLAKSLGGDAGLRFSMEYGFARGDGSGLVQGFEGVRFDSLRVSFDQANFMREGDIFTLFASRPAAISGGSAEMTLPVAAANGVVNFETAKVGLAPQARQLDLGFEYATPALGGEARIGAMLSQNAGHVSGADDVALLAGYKVTF